jgi:plasmid stabilization system protein ParE
MPLTLQQSAYFLADVEIQFRWYLDQGDVEVARRYRKAVQATMLKLQERPEAGRLRFGNDPELKDVRCCLIVKPFAKQLLFYRVERDALVMERTIHGARDLPRRLKQPPGVND